MSADKFDLEYQYQLLDRCKSDCEFFLGLGGYQEKYLWGQSVKEHIRKMRELYCLLPVKPAWCTWERINMYERIMSHTDKGAIVCGIECLTWTEQSGDGIEEKIFAFKMVGWEWCVVSGRSTAEKMISARLTGQKEVAPAFIGKEDE